MSRQSKRAAFAARQRWIRRMKRENPGFMGIVPPRRGLPGGVMFKVSSSAYRIAHRPRPDVIVFDEVSRFRSAPMLGRPWSDDPEPDDAIPLMQPRVKTL